MPIDASIPLQAHPPEMQNPLQTMGQVMQLRSAQQGMQLQSLQVQQAQRQLNHEKALDDAYTNSISVGPDGVPTFNRDKLLGTLGSSGAGSLALGVVKSLNEMDKMGAELKKTKGENATAEADYVGMGAYAAHQANDDPTVLATALGHAKAIGYTSADDVLAAIKADPSKTADIIQHLMGNSPKVQEQLVKERTATAAEKRATATQSEADIAGKRETREQATADATRPYLTARSTIETQMAGLTPEQRENLKITWPVMFKRATEGDQLAQNMLINLAKQKEREGLASKKGETLGEMEGTTESINNMEDDLGTGKTPQTPDPGFMTAKPGMPPAPNRPVMGGPTPMAATPTTPMPASASVPPSVQVQPPMPPVSPQPPVGSPGAGGRPAGIPPATPMAAPPPSGGMAVVRPAPPPVPVQNNVVPDKYDTKLTPQEEQQFQAWKAKYAPKDSGADYDLRGAFKAGLTPDPQTGHWPDTFKKPNHPTFSDQSQYATGVDAAKAGHWDGDGPNAKFIPAKVTQPDGVKPRVEQIGPAQITYDGSGRDEDMLSHLNPTVANKVRAMVEGREPFPGTYALARSPYWRGMVSLAEKYDPSFNAGAFQNRTTLWRNFTSGKEATQINALNTVTQHLTALSKAADALNNGDFKTWNEVKNWFSQEFGNKKVTNFQSIVTPVAEELTRVWRGTGGAQADIEERMKNLAVSNSPDQLHGSIGKISELLEGKLGAMRDQLAQGLGVHPEDVKVITPEAEATLGLLKKKAEDPSVQIPDKIGMPSKPSAPSSKTPIAKGVVVTDGNGQDHPFSTQAEADRFMELVKQSGGTAKIKGGGK